MTARVLIVEDELVVGLDLEHRLVEMGYEVLGVIPAGEEAVEVAATANPGLVLMDIKLAGELDGVEAARRIRANRDVPIVFLTAFADEATTTRVQAVAPHGYVVKPFQKEALRAVIETALTRHAIGLHLQESERSLRAAHERELALRGQLEAIDRAAVAVARALTTLGTDVAPFLQAVAHEARLLAGADHAAVGAIGAPGQAAETWVASGDDPGPDAASVLDVPIRFRGETRGALRVASKRGADAFTDDDRTSIEMLADRVGTALELARLRQIEARERARLEKREREQRFLADLGATLASSLDGDETVAAAARLAVGELADWCILDLVDDRAGMRRLEVAHADPARAATCEALKALPLDWTRAHLASTVLATRTPLVLHAVTRDDIEGVAQSEEHLRLLLELEPRSVMSLPLVVRNRLLGRLVLGVSTRSYGAADLELAEQVAYRIALALDNAELYETARRAVQARDDVLGVVAHDLRNPLNAILMQLELLRQQCRSRGDLPPVDAARRAAKRMSRLIREMLDVARLDAGTLTVEAARAPVAELVEEAVANHEPLAHASSLELLAHVPGALPDLWGDRDSLAQVLDNLIGNAVKFTRPGGRITVGASPRDGEVMLWVEDTGVGVALADVPHLFDRFWQARRSDRRGAGLGLTIVKGIVEAHGGRVWVESTVGEGTTVFFTIPAAPRPERRQAESEPAAAEPASPRA